MRSEEEIKDLLRHIARSLDQVLEPVENQDNTENSESVTGNTVGTSIAAALALVPPFEKNRMAQQKEFLNKYADKAPTLAEACRQLDIEDSEKLWIEGLSLSKTLKFWQPFGISWMVNKSAEIGGCILGDDMGLGKTLQACGVICHMNNERKKGNGSVGQPKPSLLKAKHKGLNKPSLQEVFDTVIIDEAHTIKDENTLAPRNFILLTGTPVMNRDIDIAAMLSLFRPDSLWEDMQCDRKTNPFRLEDNHRHAVLRAISFAVHRYLNTLPDKDHVQRAEWLGKIYDIVLLERGFGTTMNGVSIGSAIPPVKTTIIDLDIDEKEVNVMGGSFGRK
ncbi:hypothetical protein BCON_0005g00030 [Botryotinia convoluta]|uniref:Helicase ATP-binding domain-containing protein n=1 Tax=Botryotinia convoluta TaxID=54673 RepID=A0A4Z1J021_9HELO|nr:hypothetical protein BCON_0005g00030 [Botryotinia convoluta]